MNKIGLRKEEKDFESRVPIVPDHIRLLHEKYGIDFVIEPSEQRAFSHKDYQIAGATISLLTGSDVNVILGIKEMPMDFFEPSKVYVFFSHTVKGQKHNMPMLQRILNIGATLIDYERIVDERGRRLVYFGNWAGIAGLADTLHSFGLLLELDAIKPNPFYGLKPTIEVNNLHELQAEFKSLGKRIESDGIPETLAPLVVGFAGYGNVSRGAQELLDFLPLETVSPDDLFNLPARSDVLYKCVFKEEHMVEPVDPASSFDLQEYYNHGSEKYQGIFEKYIPYLTILMNCIYWTEKYPRLITKEFMRKHWHSTARRLRVIGDISCDIEGAIELTITTTKPNDPSFTYIIDEDRAEQGVSTKGPVIMAVDNLPCELPRESSTSFSTTLLEFVPSLAMANFDLSFESLDLPRELHDAVIVHRGKLTPNYEYLEKFLS